jgi:drug/metabolite transporter (DMT)-like permease
MRAATLVQFAAAFVVVAPLAYAIETNRIEWTGEFVFALAWLSLVLSVGAVTLLYVLIRRGAASNVASLFFLVPASTAVIAWALFGETLTLVEFGGVAATALGVLMVNRPGLFGARPVA